MAFRLPRTYAACLLLGASGLLGAAHAQTSVQLYGLVDAWAGMHKKTGGYARDWTQGSGGMTTSYWGLKGAEQLDNGLSAVFALEGFFRPQVGEYGRFRGDTLFSRNVYLGLKSEDLGSLTLGRQTTPYFLSTILFNPFGDSYTFSPVVKHTYLGIAGQGVLGDSGWDNAVRYNSPSAGGFSASLIYAFGNETTHRGQDKWGGSLGYRAGPFAATAAYQQVRFNRAPGDLDGMAAGFRHQRALNLGASYDFEVVKLFAQYQRVRNTIAGGNVTSDGGQIGISVPVGQGSILASYAYTRSGGASDVRRNTWAVGYDYNLTRRTDVYVAYGSDHLKGQARGDTLGVGMRLRF